jgi:Protein of unknown function (DUF3095)
LGWIFGFLRFLNMDSRFFYKDKSPLASFSEAANGELHLQLPEDWWIVVADVMGSTKAIESGRYKDVNTVGAATIMAVINVDSACEIPFIFGGDGATLAVPPHMIHGAREALLGAQKMAKDGFDLGLRVGVIPARDIFSRNMRLGVGKYRHTDKMTQTSLSGFGWEWAETALKNPEIAAHYIVTENDATHPNADFTGFQCRWKPIDARNGFKLAIIVQSTSKDAKEHVELYTQVLLKINDIYGELQDFHPVQAATLGLTFNPASLIGEVLVNRKDKGFVRLCIETIKVLFVCIMASVMFALNLRVAGVRWGGYKKEVVDNADFRKFDGTLKMVVDGSAKQEELLRDFFEKLRAEGKLIYGLHRSAKAIMTCMVFTAGQDHAHFVDGSDGGYAMAAKMMKQQLLLFKESRKSTHPQILLKRQ